MRTTRTMRTSKGGGGGTKEEEDKKREEGQRRRRSKRRMRSNRRSKRRSIYSAQLHAIFLTNEHIPPSGILDFAPEVQAEEKI